MSDFLITYGLFLAESITMVLAILIVFGGIFALVNKNKNKDREKISIKKLNDKYKEMKEALNSEILTKDELKALTKQEKALEKAENKKKKQQAKNKENESTKAAKKIFVLDFDGDLRATEVENLREAITAILTVAKKGDEVLVKIESGGGMVHAYGLAASQLQRIREHKINLVAAVDKIAASGGYMMAAVANHIIAAPFAILGSIGVLAQLPNFNRLLKKHNVDFEQITSGEYKRTLTLFGENTEKGRKKLQEEIEDTHELFKTFILEHRPQVDLEKTATGEHWYGLKALELKLVDELKTSDDYLLSSAKDASIYEVSCKIKKPLSERFALGIRANLEKFFSRLG